MNGNISLNLTTPKKLSLSIKLFIKNMGLAPRQRFLKFTKRSDLYLPSHCFPNCETERKLNGAQIVFGWIIWEDRSQACLEAEFHSVLLENNKLVDITPRVDGEETILFVPDQTRKALRVNENTWDSWTPFKSYRGNIVELSRPQRRKSPPAS